MASSNREGVDPRSDGTAASHCALPAAVTSRHDELLSGEPQASGQSSMAVLYARPTCALSSCTVEVRKQQQFSVRTDRTVANEPMSLRGCHLLLLLWVVIGDRWGGPPAGRFYAPSR